MADFITHSCFGCGAELPGLPAVYYCGDCVATQLAAQREERRAFEAFHTFADACARGPELIPCKRWKYRGQGRYVVGRRLPDGTLDIYRGARTLEGARKARREVAHWPDRVTYDQATDTEV